jgi:FixJ family two-component response regulator
LPGISGLELQAALPHHPDYERPIIFLSGTADVRASVQAMRAGASEFLTKPIQRDALLAAVQVAVGRDVALREHRRRARLARSRLESLAPRERKVLDGIVAGKLHKQMAAELGVSERTIKVDRARVMKQMGARTLADLLRVLTESADAGAEGGGARSQSAPQDCPPSMQEPARHLRSSNGSALARAAEANPGTAEPSLRIATASSLLALGAIAAAVAADGHADAEERDPAVEPEAVQALQRMGACLQALHAFGLRAKASTEEVLEDGQKIQLDFALTLRVRCPRHLRMDVSSDRKSRQFFFDGRRLVVFTRRASRYAVVDDAPPTISGLLARLSGEHRAGMPLTDLFAFSPDPARQAGLASAMAVGHATLRGTSCDQYAFRQEGLDWQLWIDRGELPLPRRFVLTTTDDEARPQHAIDLDWSLDDISHAADFAFNPPAGAKRIPTRPADGTTMSAE